MTAWAEGATAILVVYIGSSGHAALVLAEGMACELG
jgi:hypothetical protein